MLEVLRVQYGRLESQVAGIRANMPRAVVDAGHGRRDCPMCRAWMPVQKTSRRTVTTLAYRHFIALEHVTVCPNGCLYPSGKAVTGHSEELAGLVPQGGRYGYDIEVFAGIERFLNNSQRDEIREKLLSQYGLEISTGEISNLVTRFLKHIETLHYQQAPLLRAAMEADGGYPLHIDSTTEGGKGTMLVLYSGWRRWALGAWKIPSERSEYIEPRITEMAELFGEPCAIIRDLGKAMRKAATEAGEKMTNPPRQLACQFHFLQDVGIGLLDESYGRLRELAKDHNIRENIRAVIRALRQGIKTDVLAKFQSTFNSLILGDRFPHIADSVPGTIIVSLLGQWILEYRQDSGNDSYPFARPYVDLYRRCQTALKVLNVIQTQNPDSSASKHVQRLQTAICPFVQSIAVTKTLQKLCDRTVLFDSLREIFELESTMPETVLNADSVNSDKISIDDLEKKRAYEEFERKMKDDVETLLASLKAKHKMLPNEADLKKAVKIIVDHLDSHWQYLWGHLVRLRVEGEVFYRVIERTNSILESFFHKVKHRERRRSGRKNLCYDFENLPASVAIAANLLDDDYVRIMCGSLDSLPSLFSQLDQIDRRNACFTTQSDRVMEDGDDKHDLQIVPNNKVFVRKKGFNEWVNGILLQSNTNDSANDKISTSEPLSPFSIIDNLLSQFTLSEQTLSINLS